MYLNYAAVDPDLTNSKCSFWHFRFDADTSMKMEALTTYMKDEKNVKKVYLINQNYAHGHQVAKFAKETLARKRPDVQIVGEDLHPIGQVRDFAPYIAKIKASGADTVITGNWGTDLSLLIKAAKDAGLERQLLHLLRRRHRHAHGDRRRRRTARSQFVYIATPTCRPRLGKWTRGVQRQVQGRLLHRCRRCHVLPTLAAGIAKAKSTDPVKVAAAMEGLTVKSFTGEVTMRTADHQLQQPLYIATWQKTDAKKHVQRREHRQHLGAEQGVRALRVEHADLVPDEAPGRLSLLAPARARRSRLPRALSFAADPSLPCAALDQLLINLLNGISSGLLLFMLSSGLTLIFSMMGVLNFAHASFYMLGAYFAYTLTRRGRLLAGAGARAAAGRACSARCSSALCCARCTSSATCPSCSSPSACRTCCSSWCS